jgi:aminoglycoside 6-adenylyltransferase
MGELAVDHAASYERIIDRFTAWASGEATIRAAMIVGSRARTEHPADAWSDLDIVLFTTMPEILLDDSAWLDRLGTPVITFLEPTAVGAWKERRVFFEGAIDVDVAVVPAGDLAAMLASAKDGSLPGDLIEVVERGIRILVDKEGDLHRLAGAAMDVPMPASAPVDQAGFAQIVSDFWYHTVWIAKKLRRGELVVAHECLDGHQRRLLLALIRRHAGIHRPIWHGARFLEEWADPRAVGMLSGAWAHHERADIVRATHTMMDLVAMLSREIAEAYGLAIPPEAEHAARAWFDAIIATPETPKNTL